MEEAEEEEEEVQDDYDTGGDPRQAAVIREQRQEIERLKGLFAARGQGELEAKYLDALRRTKGLKLKLESEKQRADRLQRQLDSAENRVIELERLQQSALPGAQNRAQPSQPSEEDADKLRKDLRESRAAGERANKLNADLRRQIIGHKQEVGRLREVVKKEVGEGVDMEKVGAAEDAWRGRAQQITLLRSKVKDLQRQLGQSEAGSTLAGGTDTRSLAGYSCVTPATTATGRVRDFEEAHRLTLEATTAGRRAREGQLQMQLQEKEKGLKEQRERADAAHARLGVLERENTAMRQQVQRVIAKTENDDKLIDAYKVEIERGRKEMRAAQTQEKAAPRSGPEPATDFHEQRAADLDAELRQARARIRELEHEVGELHTSCPSPAKSAEAGGEGERLREYITLLRGELLEAQERERTAVARALASESNDAERKQRKEGGKGGDKLSMEVVEKINMLKGENASLKERVAVLQSTFDREVALWRDIADGRKEHTATDTDSAALEEELRSLKLQYSQLRQAYNSAMMAGS